MHSACDMLPAHIFFFNHFLLEYLLMNMVSTRASLASRFSVLLLGAFLFAGAVPVAAHAQIIFDAHLSDRGREAITDPDRMNGKKLLGLLAEEGRFVYEGKRPVKARLVVFFAGPSGTGKTMAGKPFVLKPGTHPMGRHLSADSFLALFEKAFPDDYFFPDGHFFPDGYFFPDSAFDSKVRFPDSTFEEMNLGDRQAGLVIALVPADEDLREKVQSRPMGLGLSPGR